MTFDTEQLANAEAIIEVGKELGASERDIQIALMAAMTESNLRNVDYGDRDSIGLFQQRDAWGSFDERHDPEAAARMFFTGGHAGQRGLFDFPNRDDVSMGEAAQDVQVSAYPDRYADWSDEAAGLLRDLGVTAGGEGAGGDPYATTEPPDIEAAQDDDRDGLTNVFEGHLGTDPNDADSDNDNKTDLEETTVTHTDPLSTDPGKVQLPQAAVDAGFGGADTIDSDGDGLADGSEAELGSDPTNPDTDGDKVSDAVEARVGSDPTSIDTDIDGVTDYAEYDDGTLGGAPEDVMQDSADGDGLDESTP